MPGSIAVLQDRYSEVEVAALLADVGDHGMITNSTGDRLYCEMNLGSVIIVCVRSKNFSRGRIVEANCILESTPPPHFGLDVVYKMGGPINGTLR